MPDVHVNLLSLSFVRFQIYRGTVKSNLHMSYLLVWRRNRCMCQSEPEMSQLVQVQSQVYHGTNQVNHDAMLGVLNMHQKLELLIRNRHILNLA